MRRPEGRTATPPSRAARRTPRQPGTLAGRPRPCVGRSHPSRDHPRHGVRFPPHQIAPVGSTPKRPRTTPAAKARVAPIAGCGSIFGAVGEVAQAKRGGAPSADSGATSQGRVVVVLLASDPDMESTWQRVSDWRLGVLEQGAVHRNTLYSKSFGVAPGPAQPGILRLRDLKMPYQEAFCGRLGPSHITRKTDVSARPAEFRVTGTIPSVS